MSKSFLKTGILAFGLSSILAIAMSIIPATAASASTDCETAKSAVVKFFDDWPDSGYLAGSTRLMVLKTAHELCFGGCETMRDLYNWHTFVTSAPSNLRSMVLDSWNTCVLVGDNSGWELPRPKKYKPTKAPKILGSPKVGRTLNVDWGRWNSGASWTGQGWFVCNSPKPTAQSSIVEKYIPAINLPKNDCVQATRSDLSPNTFKLRPKHKGKFVVVCQYSEDDYFWGKTCSPAIRVS